MSPKSLIAKMEEWTRTGGCKVPWKHHPPEVKDAIRRARMQPMMKQCWKNSQKLFISEHGLDDLTYHEGWCSGLIPFEHAWLCYRGELLDLTLEPGRETLVYPERDQWLSYSPEQVRDAVVRTGFWGSVDPQALAQIGPWAANWELLQKLAGSA